MAVVAFRPQANDCPKLPPRVFHAFFMLRPNLPARLHASKADPAPQSRITGRKIERHPKEEVSSARV